MINRVIQSFIFATVLLLALPVLAQTDTLNGYHVQHFTDEEGLPQNSINDLLFDDNGFLWLASQSGLIRFDGNSFKLFVPGDKPALESDVVFLGKNNTNAIYFQTRDHHLYSYPGRTRESLKLVNAPPLRGPLLLNNRRQFFDFTHFLQDPQPEEPPGIRKMIFNDLFEQKGSFYVIDPSHLYLFYSDTLYYYSGRQLEKISGFGDNSRQFLNLDKRLYVLRRDSVLAVYEDGRKVLGSSLIGGDLPKDAGLRGHQQNIYRLFAGRTNHIRVNNRLYRISPDGSGRLTAGFLLNLDFAKNISRIDYEPELDMLLIGTETEGFYFLRRSRFGMANFSAALRDQLSQYLFGPMALLPDGKNMVNTRFLFSPQGQFSMVKEDIRIRQQCLYVDKKANVWGSLNNLPRKMSLDLKPVQVFPILDAQIVDYTEDSSGGLWCLTRRSLWRFNGDSFRLVLPNSQLATSGANEAFCMVRPNKLWIANTVGLFEYDLERKQAKTIRELDGAHVRSIHVCKDGAILLGTYGQGYFYYYHGRIFHMPLDKNGFLLTAHSFLEDRKGIIWIPCNKGLFKVPKADMDSWCDSTSSQIYYYYFGRQDGLSTNEFNGGFNSSGLITPDGFASLLSMKGIVCFYTDSLKTDFPKGRIDLNNVEIDGKTIQKADSIELEPGYNSLLVEVSCPFWGNRNNLYLEYCLKGLSNVWKDVEADRIINLSRLMPGNYTLMVRKVNGFGKDNYIYREWNIDVIPNFYQRSWFIPLVILGFVLILVMVVHLWLKLIEKRKEVRVQTEKLKATVVTQKETLEKLQESQKALLQSSRMKEKLISLVIHDLRSPIRFLSMLAGDLSDNQAGYSQEEIKERAFWIKKGTNDIYNFSEDFLLWVTSQKNNFSISKRLFAVRPLLQEIHDFFSDQLQQKGNTLFYETTQDLSIYSDPHILITIIRNLVDNANKYTEKGTIRIKACEENAGTIISISDTGKGMSQLQIDSFLQNGKEEDLKSGSQLGHKFVYDLSQRIGGVVSIESKEKEGTVVTLWFGRTE